MLGEGRPNVRFMAERRFRSWRRLAYLVSLLARARIFKVHGNMGKYDPLRDYLRRQRANELELSFADIERKLGAMLPNSAALPQWWANVTDTNTSHVQREAWRAAGYDAFLILGKDRVRFRRFR